jgi:Na+-transporting methylmalonyl-CoA/oxaloacetate decarboxylase gamma subunit
MKKIILLIALSIAGSAVAQAPAPQKEAAKPEAAKPEAAKAEPSRAQKTAAVAKKSKRTQDARHCLQRANNNDIIKCAEEFL